MSKPYLDINPSAELSQEDEIEIISSILLTLETLEISHFEKLLENDHFFDQSTVESFHLHLIDLIAFAKSREYVQLKVKRGKCLGCNRDNRPYEFYSFNDFFVFALNFYRDEGKLSQVSECHFSEGSGNSISFFGR